MPITVLNVAEKNSVAREVTRLLCNGGRPQELPSCATYCKNFKFPFNLSGQPVDMVFSSVAGHLLELDFTAPYRSWRSCRPAELYGAPVAKQVTKGEGEKIKRNLQNLARNASQLILWLDCDREGENIAFEVIQVCTEVNPRLVVKRARFSALIQRDIFHAVNNLVPPNANESAAVDARQEIDLRVGSSFTRLQTLLLQERFDWSQFLTPDRDRMILSYGPCQFPTLGLIVQREWEIQAHVSELFWTIKVSYSSPAGSVRQERCEFVWNRGRLFDRFTAELYHSLCIESPTATVVSVSGTDRRKNAPVPLCTLEMQKRASQALRMSGERIMKIAEELYQGGFISYPRTETNLFAQGYDLQGLVSLQADANNLPWSPFAQRLRAGEFRWPASGGKDDGAHPPIHPTKIFTGDNNPDKTRLYEFIVRYFLACCAPDALGRETRVGIEIAGEGFEASGLMVTARNWLDVYPWASFGGEGTLPAFNQGQTFQPARIRLHESATMPPPRMREADLLAKMDAFGIGTDATVADHIAKQLERGYATKDNANQTFVPTPLGESLISAYRKMGLGNLWVPTLRGVIEQNINAVARGQRSKDEVLAEAVQAFAADFAAAASKTGILEQEVRDIVFQGHAAPPPAAGGGPAGDRLHGGQPLGPCSCSEHEHVVLIPATADTGPIIRCTAPPALHGITRELPPRSTRSATISTERCACGLLKLHLSFNGALLPPAFRHMAEYTCCVACDDQLRNLLSMVGPPPRRAAPRQPQQYQQGRGGAAAGTGGANRGRGGRAGGARGGRRGGAAGRGGGRGGRAGRGAG